ncbi:galacturonosyltransferase-like 3 [Pyrus ussuriensis x Pyrus communis]|uniref:Galacturonosyltransferase-like 3 n=1 Tax=Pyrus ussuriensis x Pyrus communis TaxID=2448454 RepID=A0A5N5GV91_9ROSA|nr:galacturonosyltransferase-like 3 [Pyrus ussuriensis x Pyrus communis]
MAAVQIFTIYRVLCNYQSSHLRWRTCPDEVGVEVVEVEVADEVVEIGIDMVAAVAVGGTDKVEDDVLRTGGMLEDGEDIGNCVKYNLFAAPPATNGVNHRNIPKATNIQSFQVATQ